MRRTPIKLMKNIDLPYRRIEVKGERSKVKGDILEARVRRRVLRLLPLVLFLVGTLMSPVHAKVYIDIDSPGFRRLPLAVLSLDPRPGDSPCPDREIGKNLEEVLLNDLDVSGFFRTLSPDAFLVVPFRGFGCK